MSKIIKRLLFVLAIICLFLIVPCSFASDLENNTLSDNVANENSIYVSVDGDDSIADGSVDKPYHNISKAVDKYDSKVNSNIFVKNGTYVFDESIEVTKGISIVGESREGVIFEGNNNSAFFSFSSNPSSLNSISFVNGYTAGGYNPGVVHAEYKLIIDDCIFKNCSGSAVTIEGRSSDFMMPNVQIKNSEFINNNNSAWGGHGAAINANGMYYVLNITNCVFVNNWAYDYGGAIYIGSTRKEPVINNCKFIRNTADEGSAIYVDCSSDLTITSCNFTNNSALSDNSAVIVAEAMGDMKTLTIGKNTFANNTPSKEIDANNFDTVYMDANVRLSGDDVDMNAGENVKFIVTLKDTDGNPIFGKVITVNLVDALFKRTTTYTGITNRDGQAKISLVNQTAGTYTVTSIFAGDANYDAVNATNTIKIKSDYSYNVVFNETIIKVKAGESYLVQGIVAGEYLSWALPAFTTLNFQWTTHSGGTRYTENYGINNGRFLIDVLDFDLTTQSEYYYINFTATYDNGPAAYGQLIIDTSIVFPPVDEAREIIYVAKDGSDEFGDGSEENPLATPQTAFYVNEMYGGGRTIFIKEGVYDISNYEIYANVTVIGEKGKTIFRQHTGEEGMLILDNWVTTDFINITFIDGYRSPMAIFGGSVIIVEYAGSIAHFSGCEFYNNSGSSDGMMYVAYGGIVYIDDCIFKNNSGKTLNPAGAILVLNGYLSVNNSYFEANYGSEGGAIFVAGEDAVAFIENTEFRGNIAYNDSYAISGGGAIYVNNWNVHITNCSFIENYAEINGGAIYILTGKVEIDRCYFENNRVKEDGGNKGSAIASDSGYTVMLYVTNSILISDGYSRLVSIVNNAVEQENEIKLDGNHWGINGQSGVQNYVIVKPTIPAGEIYEGDLVEITVNFALNTGEILEYSIHDYLLNISASLGDVDKNSITIHDNVAKFNYYAKNSGNEVITFSHGRNTYTLKFNVNESEINKQDVNANISVDDNKTKILVQVPDDLENNITIILDDIKYSIKANSTLVVLPIYVNPGNHEVRVSYAGDGNYKSSISDVFTFSVDKYKVNLSISVANIVIGDDIIANITANSNFNENVIVTVNNKDYTVKLTNGSALAKINDLTPGIYTAYVEFTGNDFFVDDTANSTFEVSQSPVKVIYVAVNGSDSAGNGSQDAPYATISKALERNNRIGGGRTVIINEGNYTISRFAITTDVNIKADGNVIISAANGKNHLFIGGNVKVALEGLTFINGNGVDAGSIEMGSDESGNVGKELNITNCKFINNTGAVGAIVSYAKTNIKSSTFINNTATGVDGFNQGIISVQDNVAEIEYSIFMDNNYANYIILSGAPCSANNNFWGTNDKTSDVKDVEINSWIGVIATIADDVRTKTDYDLNVSFMETADGVNFQSANGVMQDLVVDLTSQIGLINPTTVTISNNIGTVNYNSTAKGTELITVYLEGNTLSNLSFTIDVPEYDKIYVSPTGNDLNNGSLDNPVLTVACALAKNNESGGHKTIIILPGTYKEHGLVIDDDVVIIGGDATIDGEGNSIFTVLADSVIQNLTLTNANCAIDHESGELEVYESNFTNSANVIISKGNLIIENSQFTKNTGNVLNTTSLFGIYGCEFSQNIVENIISGYSGTFLINGSKFINNEVKEVIYLNNSFGDIIGNVFDSNGIALSAVGAVLEITDNTFNGAAINLNSSKAGFESNNNTIINLVDSEIISVVLTFLNGETVIANNGTIQLNATVTDDMSNPINGGDVTFTANGNVIGQANVIKGVATLNAPFTKGNYTISGSFDSDSYEKVNNGLLRIDVDYYWFIGEDKYETLDQAIAAAKWGDVIKGLPGTYIISKQQIGHRYLDPEPWEILKSVTITSINVDPVTLTSPNSQMFYVDIGSELTLKNIIVADSGNAGEDGTIETLYGCNLTIINCTFVNNIGENGGAIYAGGNLTIKDSIFDNNRAALAGAVEIAYLYYTTGQITIQNVNFTNNKAEFAGALYCGASDVDMVNVKFINNTANIGGALFVRDGTTRITDAEFISNKAVNSETTVVSRGGAVHNMLGNLYFENTKFINNTAEGIGGALELENGQYGDIRWTTFDNCEFINNSAYSGGAMYLGEEYDPYVRITNAIFDSNVAETDGAAIYDNCAHVTIEKAKFVNNKAGGLDVIHVIGEFISGEGLYVDEYYYGQLTIEDSSFADDDADYIIFSNIYGVIDIRNTNFTNENMIIFNRGEATFIKDTVVNSKDAVIENYGTLSLTGNVFDTPILNKKDILTTTYIVVLDNETKFGPTGENYILNAVITDDNGNIIDMDGVIFVVDSTDIAAQYSDAKFTANYTVTAGTHFVTAKFTSDALKELKLKPGILIAKPAAAIEVNVESAKVGENATIKINIDPQASGNISVTVDNKTYVSEIKNGLVTIILPELSAGDYDMTISYSGDENFSPSTQTKGFAVSKITDYKFDVNVANHGIKTVIINVVLPEDICGNITVNVDGDIKVVPVSDGKANVTYSGLGVSDHNLVVTFKGNDKYAAMNKSQVFRVAKIDSFVKVTVDDVILGDDAIINIVVPEDATGDVIISCGKEYLVTITGSKITYAIPNLALGAHNVEVTYNGDGKYLDSSNSTSFNVIRLAMETKLEITAVKDNSIVGVLKDDEGNGISGQNITYVVNGTEKVVKTNGNGEFTIPMSGNAKVEIIFAGNDEYKSSNISFTFNSTSDIKLGSQIKVNAKFICYAVDYSAGERGAKFKVTLLDSNGQPIKNAALSINMGGTIFNLNTNSKGVATVQINKIKAGTHSVSIMYLGDGKHNATFAVSKLVVKKKTIKIVAKKKTFKAKTKTKKYKITVKTIKGSSANGKTYLKSGMKLTLKIKGKTYRAKINKKGKATFKIKKLTKKGKYTAVIKFKGDSIYKKATKKVKIKIK